MPFTPYHFGINALPALATDNKLDLSALVLANVIIDVEPLLVLALDLDYPLHGYAHTMIGGAALGLALGLVLYAARSVINSSYRLLGLKQSKSLKSFVYGGIVGGLLHVALDALIYEPMFPLWPLERNYLYAGIAHGWMLGLCVMGIVAATIAFVLRRNATARER
jgi:membrane-bound metal-dependent hydrolase YbcI (DUF457 family)